MLSKVKKSLRINTDAFDDELEDLICAALLDLGIGDIDRTWLTQCDADPLIRKAVITYVKMNFGDPENADRLHESYVEQKSQLITSSQYTTWR